MKEAYALLLLRRSPSAVSRSRHAGNSRAMLPLMPINKLARVSEGLAILPPLFRQGDKEPDVPNTSRSGRCNRFGTIHPGHRKAPSLGMPRTADSAQSVRAK